MPGQRLSLRTAATETDHDLLLVDWDGGCVVDTVHFRIEIAQQAAALVWPNLEEKIRTAAVAVATATSKRKTSWLTNKLEAIAPVLHEDTRHFSATAQYVLAVRLLLEEQELDQGRSPGTGKYGSLYHPQQPEDQQEHDASSDNFSRGSRPLTVGEVSMNWCDLLLDTLPIKYQVRPHQLEEAVSDCMKRLHARDQADLFTINTAVASILATMANGQAFICYDDNAESRKRTLPIVTVRHENDLPLAQALMVEHFKDSSVQVQLVDQVDQLWSVSYKQPTIYILRKQRNTIAKLLDHSAARNSTNDTDGKSAARVLHVVESSWEALQWDTSHDNHPVVSDEQGTDLKLTAWCLTPEMERRATMCPWSSACTSVIDLEEKLGIQHVAFE